MFLPALVLALNPLPSNQNPPELGRVHFGRDLEQALAGSKSSGKPVLALFQEIPGCATCKGFGRGPLARPLLVEAIETQFVPLAILNNAGGADAAALKRFGEAAWNNPVVRFVDARGDDVLPRADGVWSESGIAQRLVAALTAAKRDVPAWLELARDELDETSTARAVLGMRCFWEGQAKLGSLAGVVDVRPCFVEGAEACEVRFRPASVAYATLVKSAQEMECASTVWAVDAEQEKEASVLASGRVKRLSGSVKVAAESHDLRTLKTQPALMLLPLTRAQRVRANALLDAGEKLEGRALTPRQTALAGRIERALQDRPATLEGLAFPADAHELGAYEDELQARLTREK
jgi:hypothetical protein